MKQEGIYSVAQLAAYLKSEAYHLTYRQGSNDAYYNPRNRQYIFIPIFHERLLSKEEIIELFTESKATDLPPELEYHRFTLYLHAR
ncbi:hypothetical protein ATE84_2887 [Aquimarina sp. MAR_2010_214]|nr:hypothetical protein ATE84_2887 [Aquimarina sp. MAR_2010_214]